MAINPLSSVLLSTNDIGLDRAFVPVDIQRANIGSPNTSAKGIVSVLAGSLDANGAYTAGPITVNTTALPASLGPKTGALSLSVVPNTDTPFPVVGNIASGATDSGNPVKIGGVASATTPSSVASGQRVNAWYGLDGRQYSTLVGAGGVNGVPAFNPADGIGLQGGLWTVAQNMVWNGSTLSLQRGDINGTIGQPFAGRSAQFIYAAPSGGINVTTTQVIMSATASIKNALTSIDITTDGAVTLACDLLIQINGVTLWRCRLPLGFTSKNKSFDIPLVGTANASLLYVLTGIPGVPVYVNAQGFQSAL